MDTDSFLESLVAEHGEVYREVIESALENARIMPGFNPATFNFARYIAAVVFTHSVSKQ